MKILVTGGAGFIGSHIVDAYVDLGYQVVVIDDLSSGKRDFVNKNAKFYQADICNKEAVRTILNKEKPEVINHHAAQISVRVSVENPVLDAKINILGLINLFENGKKYLKKFIFASSGGVVYGDADILPTPEEYQPKNPISPYGVTKLAGEKYLYYYFKAANIPFVALRYSNVYGPRQNPHGEAGVVAIFTKKLLKEDKPVINGDGTQTRDYIYVGDVTEANKISLAKKNIGCFNIGTGLETDVNEIFENLKKVINSKARPKHAPAKKGEQKRSCLNTTKAKEELGFIARTDLLTGFRKTVDYFKENG